MDLALRKQKILAAVVESYIETGEPIGSKALHEQTGFEVSPATIRNEMADLTNKGYLIQPHTSAGRIPTEKGYRFYVDHLLEVKPLDERVKAYIDSRLESNAQNPEEILKEAGKAVSELTDFAAVTTTPSGEESRIHKIKFVQTGQRTAMAVLITSAGAVKSRLFRCEFVLTSDVLRVFERALNERLAGLPLSQLNQPNIQTIAASFGELSLFMPSVLMAIKDAAVSAEKVNVSVSGQTRLLFLPEVDFISARNVVDFLSSTKNISDMFKTMNTGTVYFIGRENKRPELFNSSVITTRYEIENQPAGVIAVIGPIRMDYSAVASVLDYTAGSVGGLLSEIIKV